MTTFAELLDLPITFLNGIWIFQIIFLSFTFVIHYYLHHGFKQLKLNKISSYILQYGKSQDGEQLFELPKRFFLHFYIVATVWCTYNSYLLVQQLTGVSMQRSWVADVLFIQTTENPVGSKFSLLLAMFLLNIQVVRRLYECVFVSIFSKSAKINFLQYAWGILYYILVPATLISECVPVSSVPVGSFCLRHLVGVIIFTLGSLLQYKSHVAFANLRHEGGKKDGYVLPTGSVFQLVSCPHYLGEVIIYVGIGIVISIGCRSWWLVIGYNVIAHINMAMSSHVWYKEKFGKVYPAHRKALIPFVL